MKEELVALVRFARRVTAAGRVHVPATCPRSEEAT